MHYAVICQNLLIDPTQMSGEFNWRNLLKKSESKSRGSNTNNRIQLSSIDAWKSERLPKMVVIWTFRKNKSDSFPSNSRPGRFSKRRDLSATVESFELFLIDSDQYAVPWTETPSHAQIVRMQWTPKWHNTLKENARKLNSIYCDRPIQLQYSFKNEGGIMRLQYEIKNYKKLPPTPPDLEELLSPLLDTLIGTQIRLWKDHSKNSGPKGWFDNKMAKWEHKNQKNAGNLWVKLSEGEWQEYPEFSNGRQDYWTGFAIDFLMAKLLPGFEDMGGHATGVDHSLDFDLIQPKKRRGIFSKLRDFFFS